MAASLGLSKVFILDKYFTELQKFWETEKKLQGIYKSYFIIIIIIIINTYLHIILIIFYKN